MGVTGAWIGYDSNVAELIVLGVEKGSPADGALIPGDILLATNGHRFSEWPDAVAIAGYALTEAQTERLGGVLTLQVMRGGTFRNRRITLGVRGEYSRNWPFGSSASDALAEDVLRNLMATAPTDRRLGFWHPNVPTPAYSDGYVFWSVGYGKGGICLKLSVSGQDVKATEVWRTQEIMTQYGGYVILGDYIYGNNMYKWSCLELKTGKKLWGAEGVRKGSISHADGMLYLYGIDKGQIALAAATPEGLTFTGNFNVAGMGSSRAPPVIAGGRLYLRYDEDLYCFDVKAR